MPFGVFCEKNSKVRKIVGVDLSDKLPIKVDNGEYMANSYGVDEIRLLLRPFSKMTDEEIKELAYGVISYEANDKMAWIYEHGID